MYTKTKGIEVAIAKHFDYRRNLIVPNVSWGLGLHECDVLIMSNHGFLTEIEIKVSLQDLKKDLKKSHGHNHKKIKYLYFAIPSKLAKHIEYIPQKAGILVVNSKGKVFVLAKPQARPGAVALSQTEQFKMARLGAMRVWSLKAANLRKK